MPDPGSRGIDTREPSAVAWIDADRLHAL
jgi:hypothetical protein